MVKIRKKPGIWQHEDKILLYYERCPNSDCLTDELHYPLYMRGPFCPECKTKLMGNKLMDGLDFRTRYHLELGV